MKTQWIFFFTVLVTCLLAIQTGSAATNLVSNGGFEKPLITSSWTYVYAGNVMGAWTVSSNSISICRNDYWQPHSGRQSIDLSGNKGGSIIQSLKKCTSSGLYSLSFWRAASPDYGTTKKVTVYWNKKLIGVYAAKGISSTNMGWTKITIPNLRGATGGSSLAFKDVHTDGRVNWGMALDDVSVVTMGQTLIITTISPRSGSTKKNTVVTLYGSNFRTEAVVQIIRGSTVKQAPIRSIASNKIVCTFPTKSATIGPWNVKITNDDGTTVIRTGGFTVTRGGLSAGFVSGSVSGMVSSNPVSEFTRSDSVIAPGNRVISSRVIPVL